MANGDGLESTAPTGNRRRKWVTLILSGWLAVVGLYFLWEAYHYSGLYGWLAERQYARLGHYLPNLTFMVLLIVLGLPAAWIFRARRALRREGLADQAGPAAAVYAGNQLRRLLFALSFALAVAALGAFLWTFTLPRFDGPSAPVSVDAGQAAPPPTGPAVLHGQIVHPLTATHTRRFLIGARSEYFAPVVAVPKDGQKNTPPIRYFVELPAPLTGPQAVISPLTQRSGVLVRNGLPGSIEQLYQEAGHAVEAPFYVLYVSPDTLRRPYYITACQLLLAALVALIAALVQRRHVRQIGTREGQGAAPAA
jgi:hypothetical protein